MKIKNSIHLSFWMIASMLATLNFAFCQQTQSSTQTPVPSTWRDTLSLQLPFEEIGTLTTRTAREIESSGWSIGGETLDRDYADYESYKKYLGPLGAKRIRFQGGWAKCEKEKGQYDFTWLDQIIDDALSQGVQPWVEFSYGNPIYKGGGEAKLAGGIPRSAEALQAWDKWVRAMTERYKDRIKEWEIWNEPDLNKEMTPEDFAKFHIRTAEIVRSIHPNAKIWGLAIASISDPSFTDQFLAYLKKEGKLNLIDKVLFHGYAAIPSTSYPDVEKLRKVVNKYSPGLPMMQGENGCPSTPSAITTGALSTFEWTELSQAKWDLRRMMGDLGRDYDTNVFTLSDLYYTGDDHLQGLNSKGLLKANPDKTIERPKVSYYAVQNTMSLFDHTVERVKDYQFEADSDQEISSFAYRSNQKNGNMVVTWFSGERPSESLETTPVNFTLKGVSFTNPVYVNLITGKVYRIPKDQWEQADGKVIMNAMPMFDAPVLIAEEKLVLR